MKTSKQMLKWAMILVFIISVGPVKAQAPYNQGIGVTVGTFFGPTYKTFLKDKMALQVDFGVKFNTVNDALGVVWDLEVNPNLLYQSPIGTGGLYWFAGGGLSIGYAFAQTYKLWGITNNDYFNMGKAGLNVMAGLEYQFRNIPLSLQFDFRPGCGVYFATHSDPWFSFDWVLGLGVKYTF